MPRGKTKRNLDLIEACYDILVTIHPASVRAVCYQLFTRGLLESMAKRCTDRVSKQLVYARENEIIPWEWIVDETRAVERVSTWDDPQAFVQSALHSYRRDWWAAQPVRIEVWSEKGTVRGTLAPVLRHYAVAFRVLHGFGSATVVHGVAEESGSDACPLRVFYVGDWDPSGLCMSERDLPERLAKYGGEVGLHRIALSPTDVYAGSLPSFEATTKRSDSRYKWFVEHYGAQCWELDALSPVTLRERIETVILGAIDQKAWKHYEHIEEAERRSLEGFLQNWHTVISRQASI
jgi:hypothetical protein